MRWLRRLAVSAVATWAISAPVNAAQTPCAVIDHQQGWPIIGEQCDIGEGLWGNQALDPNSHAFWIQCGATEGVPSRAFFQSLRQGLPDLPFQVHLRDGRGRCLIGPYDNPDVARLVLQRVRQFGPTQKAVMRQTRQPLSEPAVIRLPPLATQAKSAASSSTMAKSTMPASASTINLNHFGLPEPEAGDQQYVEKDINWLRIDYAGAMARCQKEGMMLASQADLAAVSKATDQLPMRLPYWVQGAMGVDARTGKVVTRNADAALNVLCKKR
ncbi:hypothetical protein [Salinivibrio sp. YCSC6]|uniref:hypothetical protein n=1 Tax=Salinivibrio sp. YCSC6 TaxID=2003370 RepID=UPI000BBC01F0|nr:hypothetical protein [Salinivibrio sp. YCSC6]PCE68382.1 hypothetical protein B6G00_08820 [Salinivibrio sp. YCSC6]QCF34734.1 hypothetical protein E8E00_00210 [Salinivibrio sp. YCSC6]